MNALTMDTSIRTATNAGQKTAQNTPIGPKFPDEQMMRISPIKYAIIKVIIMLVPEPGIEPRFEV